jgi:HSP20 family protein
MRFFFEMVNFVLDKEVSDMANVTKLPVKMEQATYAPERSWWPLTSLRRDINRLFEDFDGGLWMSPLRRSMFAAEPFWGRGLTFGGEPAVDVTETDKAYEIAAELPGMDEKNIEVKLSNDNLVIKGEKQEEKEEKKKDYYLHERHFGSFERSFRLPEAVDINKIEATFSNGVLKVTLPKTPEAQKAEKKITVKAA